jgi:hypothetical protein
MEDTWLKMLLMLLETPGIIAPAATATKPAMRAYSMRSWPRRSRQACMRRRRARLLIIVLLILLPLTAWDNPVDSTGGTRTWFRQEYRS